MLVARHCGLLRALAGFRQRPSSPCVLELRVKCPRKLSQNSFMLPSTAEYNFTSKTDTNNCRREQTE